MSARVYGASPVKRRRRTRAELAAIDAAIITAVEDEHPVTLRGCYYRVVSSGAVEKTETGYELVGRQLLKLRRAGVIPYGWIADGTRSLLWPMTYDRLTQMLDDAAASYRRALWNDQQTKVLILTEKDAISGAIRPVTDAWDVALGVVRGYASETFAYTLAEVVVAVGKPVLVYQLGDHDPSGIDAWRDLQRKVRDFADSLGLPAGYPLANGGWSEPLYFERLAVTERQIDELGLQTRPTKRTDSRAAGFAGESVEVDAIPATVLRRLVEHAITAQIDDHAYRLTMRVEAEERRLLTEIAGSVS